MITGFSGTSFFTAYKAPTRTERTISKTDISSQMPAILDKVEINFGQASRREEQARHDARRALEQHGLAQELLDRYGHTMSTRERTEVTKARDNFKRDIDRHLRVVDQEARKARDARRRGGR